MTEPGPQSSEPGGTNRPTPPPPPPAASNPGASHAWTPPPAGQVNPPAYGGGQAYAGGPATRPGQITAVAVIAFVMGAFQLYAAFSNFTVATSIGLYLGFAPGVLYVLAFVNLILAGLLIWGGLTTLQGRTNKILFWTAVAVLVCGVIFNIMVRNYGLLFLPIILPGIILGLLWQQPNKDWFVAQGGTTV